MTKDLWICLITLAILIGLSAGWAYQRYRPRPDVMVSDGPAEYLLQRSSTTAQRLSWANTYTSPTNYMVIPDTGVYRLAGVDRYVFRGKDVTQEEYTRLLRAATKAETP